MANYPTNFNDPSQVQDNVVSREQFKNLNRNTVGQGTYPTDQVTGTGVLVNRTQVNADLNTALTNLEGEINAYQAAVAALSADEVKYFVHRNHLRMNKLMHDTLRVADLYQELTLEADKVADEGVPAEGRYPSGRNRGW